MITITGKEEIISRASDLLSDESRFTLGIPNAVYFPESENELQDLIKDLHKKRQTITFSGARTGITGGAVPTEKCALISFSKFNKIKKIKVEENRAFLTCDPGITLKEISSFLEKPDNWPYHVSGVENLKSDSWFYAPDPTEMTAQLGGTIATNASGARSFKFGATRDSIESLSVILASGEKINISKSKSVFQDNNLIFHTDSDNKILLKKASYNSPNIKNASGYFSSPKMNEIDLFIGSEGTLGAISSATLILQKKLPAIAGLSFFSSPIDAFSFADYLRSRDEITAIEYFDETALPFLIENRSLLTHKLSDFPDSSSCAIYWEYSSVIPFTSVSETWEHNLLKCNSSLFKTWSGYTKKEKELLKQFRHSVPELVNTLIGDYKKNSPTIRKISSDTAVPAKHFNELYDSYNDLLKKSNLKYLSFGHLGNYHLHFNIIPKTENEMNEALSIYKEMMKIAISFNGTISAEHGIGKIKKEYLKLMFEEKGVSEMERIKRTFDPLNQLNPETLF